MNERIKNKLYRFFKFLNYIYIMRAIISILFFLLILSCSSKYKGSHNNVDKFLEDISLCLNKSFSVNKISNLYNFSIISSLHAYGGGGMSSSTTNKISYKVFNICMKEKGYYKDNKGNFNLPYLKCE